MATRIYQPVPLAAGALRLDEKASHHLARVLRAAIGDDIILFNGEGGEYRAVIRAINKKNIDVEVLEFSSRSAESPVKLILAQGIARGEKMDFVIQKAVELGVSEIYPVVTERCNVRLDKEREQKRLEHWRAVVISACEQCGRNSLPILHPAISLPDLLQAINAQVKFILVPTSNDKLKSSATKSAALLIGPEGGLSDQEIKSAVASGFTALNLGPRVLRTETAALTSLAILQFQFGDL